ncbi:hypothetical protein Glove_328g119 [Diversispora epigaea]|uniref:Uncharacterized protein n=1 Tax=Diversispora epigaea TaxID=1348612 RepID=A0A397HKZ1_9GLOM|nr:hypothetical protein Glove_328g119 [Diversispora epigaea]
MHFHFDQNKLHEEGLKKKIQTVDSLIQYKRCLFCGINKYFYSREKICLQHLWNLLGRNLQIPCIGQTYCPTLKEQNYSPIIYSTTNSHLHCRPGKGKPIKTCQETGLHKEDTTLALKLFSKLILNIAESENTDMKKNLLHYLSPTLQIFINNDLSSQSHTIYSSTSTSITSPSNFKLSNTFSPFIIKTAIKLKHINIDDNKTPKDLLPEDCIEFGNALANKIWISKTYLKENYESLETPKTLKQYFDVLPRHLTGFFDALIYNLTLKHYTIANRKAKQEQRQIKSVNLLKVHKTSAFLSSIILNTAFKAANPCNRLQIGSNIWNIAVIDNIDIMTKSFTFGNIYNTTRQSSHTILRMVFQYNLPVPLTSFLNIKLNNIGSVLGPNITSKNILEIFNNIFDKLLFENLLGNNYNTNFCTDTIHQEIITQVEYGCQCESPNVVHQEILIGVIFRNYYKT